MKQNHELRIKCDADTHEKIKREARKVHMSIKDYVLFIVKNTNVKVSCE